MSQKKFYRWNSSRKELLSSSLKAKLDPHNFFQFVCSSEDLSCFLINVHVVR